MAMIMCSLHRWYGESATPRISESRSRRLRVSVIRGVDNSGYQWYGESPTLRIGDSGSRCLNTFWKTPRITDTESRQLPASVIQGVVNSAHRWYGESLFEKNLFSVDFPNFKQLNHAFKGPIWQKIGQRSNLLSQLINPKVWKKW